MYQRRFCPRFDLRTGTTIQFGVTLLLLLPLAVWLEDLDPAFSSITWSGDFVIAWLWSVFALSIGATFLLFTLIRRSQATEVTSLMYLTPPTPAIMAWLLFGESFSLLGLAGMVVAVTGVAVVVKKPRSIP
jgi:drug/metabolite transporter (DMT)-like permease